MTPLCNFVKFSPPAFKIDEKTTIDSPIMKATTGFEWCAGTSSSTSLGDNAGVPVTAGLAMIPEMLETAEVMRLEALNVPILDEGKGSDGVVVSMCPRD